MSRRPRVVESNSALMSPRRPGVPCLPDRPPFSSACQPPPAGIPARDPEVRDPVRELVVDRVHDRVGGDQARQAARRGQ